MHRFADVGLWYVATKKPRLSRWMTGRSSNTPGRDVSIRCINSDARLFARFAARSESYPSEISIRCYRSRSGNGMKRILTIFVVLFVIGEGLATANTSNPLSTIPIPVNGPTEASFQRDGGAPS